MKLRFILNVIFLGLILTSCQEGTLTSLRSPFIDTGFIADATTPCKLELSPGVVRLNDEVLASLTLPEKVVKARLLDEVFEGPKTLIEKRFIATGSQTIKAEYELEDGTSGSCQADLILENQQTSPFLPSCSISGPNTARINEAVVFTVAQNNTVSARVKIGEQQQNLNASTFRFTPTSAGSIAVEVFVKNALGNEASCQHEVVVSDNPEAPTCSISGPMEIDEGEVANFDIQTSNAASKYYMLNNANKRSLSTDSLNLNNLAAGDYALKVEVTNKGLDGSCVHQFRVKAELKNLCDGTDKGYDLLESYKTANVKEVRTIKDLEDLRGRNHKDSYIKLMNDLDFANYDQSEQPLQFNLEYAIFDGQGFTIRNMTIDRPFDDTVGLFASTECAIVRNLKLKNALIKARTNVGLIAGQAHNSRFENIEVSNSSLDERYGLIFTGSHAGGVAGFARQSSFETIKVSNLYIENPNVADKTGITGRAAGGVVGELYKASHSTGSSKSYPANTISNVTIEDVKLLGSGMVVAGGVAGHGDANYKNIKVKNLEAHASVEAGGVMGSYITFNAGQSFRYSQALGQLKETLFEDITLENLDISAARAGGVTGVARGEISDVDARQLEIATTSVGGGLVGFLAGDIMSSKVVDHSVTGNSSSGFRDYAAGGIAGFLRGDIRQSSAQGTVKASGQQMDVGGLVGEGYCSVYSSKGYGSVEADLIYTRSFAAAGGLVGDCYGDIEKSFADVEVKGRNTAGGLAGHITIVKESYAVGNVIGGENVGGLIGKTHQRAIIRDSYATGDVHGEDLVGGLVGLGVSLKTFESNYSTGKVTAENEATQVGGLIGSSSFEGPRPSDSNFWDKDTSGVNSSPVGFRKSTADMFKAATYNFFGDFWDFDNIWEIDEGNDYPKLRNVVKS